MYRIVLLVVTAVLTATSLSAAEPLRVGFAQTDITPPNGFPMAGYYHERLAEGAIDPLLAKAIVFSGEHEQAALVVCDLIGISIDLSTHIRREASDRTGIPVANIVVAGTHSHTAPDYGRELYLVLAGTPGEPARRVHRSAHSPHGRRSRRRPGERRSSPALCRLGATGNPGLLQPPVRDARRQRPHLDELHEPRRRPRGRADRS
ncbi:MAG: hypothetical protein U0992_17055 [Planctomycetaceae bacterium]